MMIFSFEKQVEDVLFRNGWSPDRAVDIEQYLRPLEKEGFHFNTYAKMILGSFAGIKITPPPNNLNLFFPSEIGFDPHDVASGELDRVRLWESYIGDALSPIGSYDPIYLLLCTDDKRVYGARERKLMLLGSSFEEALKLRILAHRRPVAVIPGL